MSTEESQKKEPEAPKPGGSPSLIWNLVGAVLLVVATVLVMRWIGPSGPAGPTGTTSGGPVAGSPSPGGPVPPPPLAVAPETPFIGQTPTVDLSSWLFIPGDFLLGAIKEIDQKPDTALTPDQLKKAADLVTNVAKPGEALVAAETNLRRVAMGVLRPEQQDVIARNRDAVLNTPLDLDALVSSLQTKAQSAGPGPGDPWVKDPVQNYAPNFIIASLIYLDKSPAPLKPTQAKQLLPVVTEYGQKLKAQAAVYPDIPKLLNEKQMQAMVAVLDDMKTGKRDPNKTKVSLAEFSAHLQSRMAAKK